MEDRLKYAQGMMYFCEMQGNEWKKIQLGLKGVLAGLMDDHKNISAKSSNERSESRAQTIPAPPEDPARVRFRMRVAHLMRGLIFIFALGMPRVFYYVYGGYALIVLSGILDELQSAQVRQFFTGARPSLDIQLVRLRQRREYLERLKTETDPEEEAKMRDFVATFPTEGRPWGLRFLYQSVFMLFYSALPSCYPHPEYLT